MNGENLIKFLEEKKIWQHKTPITVKNLKLLIKKIEYLIGKKE